MAVYIPYIRNYAPFYIQRESDASALDIQSAFGVTVKAHEYPLKRKAKQPYKTTWLDRDGDDEYIGNTLCYEAITLRLSCVILANASDSELTRLHLAEAASLFKESLRGQWFRIYDSWAKTGFRKVRLSEFPEIREGDFRVKDGKCRLLFDVLFQIGDPITQVRYQNGSLVDMKTHGDGLLVLAAEDGRFVITEDGKLIRM